MTNKYVYFILSLKSFHSTPNLIPVIMGPPEFSVNPREWQTTISPFFGFGTLTSPAGTVMWSPPSLIINKINKNELVIKM